MLVCRHNHSTKQQHWRQAVVEWCLPASCLSAAHAAAAPGNTPALRKQYVGQPVPGMPRPMTPQQVRVACEIGLRGWAAEVWLYWIDVSPGE